MESWAADDVTATIGEAKQRQFLRVIAASQNSSREHGEVAFGSDRSGAPIACCLSAGVHPASASSLLVGDRQFPSGLLRNDYRLSVH